MYSGIEAVNVLIQLVIHFTISSKWNVVAQHPLICQASMYTNTPGGCTCKCEHVRTHTRGYNGTFFTSHVYTIFTGSKLLLAKRQHFISRVKSITTIFYIDIIYQKVISCIL